MTRIETNFNEILNLIQKAKYNALKTVNSELITLYWNVGEYISKKVEKEEWGKHTIENLAKYLKKAEPEIKGFEIRNLFRMKQFYESYKDNTKLSTLLTQLSWSSHLHILSKTKTIEEKEFYIQLSIKERYSVRELERQLDSCYYERTMLSKQKVSALSKQLNRGLTNNFKDTYILEFLNLPGQFSEKDLRKSIINNFKKFILEFGKDFTFVREEYKIQVGNNDFFIDLLFFHRELRCLVVFELKIDEFKPEYLGKLNFYLEALDRDLKKQHENPSVGFILCKCKDKEVVEYTLSRSLSPALIAEYKTKLISKQILQNKLQEFSELVKIN